MKQLIVVDIEWTRQNTDFYCVNKTKIVKKNFASKVCALPDLQ